MAISHEYVITWFIENYSFCYQKNKEQLKSPKFIADGLEGTSWFLNVYPRGHRQEDEGYISFFLYRSTDSDGPENLPLKYQLSLIKADGSPVSSKNPLDFTFKPGTGYGWFKLLKNKDVFLTQKTEYLPEDTLTLRCKMWKDKGQIEMSTHIYARTRIGIERVSFINVMENFSTCKPNEKWNINIRSSSETDFALTNTLYISDCSSSHETLVVEMKLNDVNHILSKCKMSLVDASGAQIKCGKADNRFDDLRKDICKFDLFLTRDDILKRKSVYLPKDKLSLFCDCVFSTGVEYEKIERILHEIPFLVLDQMSKKEQNKETDKVIEKLSECSDAQDDFTSLYNSQLFTDVLIKTKTKTFPAHKIVLCARSPVFKAMLTNDMKEKNTDCIQIDDLEDDIIEKFLHFLYSDIVENLLWNSAVKLYYAADKYEIERLKVLCSYFLLNNLNASYASELLLLADTHNDSDLKKTVEDFIFKNETQVFSSHE